MKKTFQTSEIKIVEVIYNQSSKNVTLKKWQKKEKSKNLYECIGKYECYTNELEDFAYCSLRDIENACGWNFKNNTDYPYKIKHISKFNIY